MRHLTDSQSYGVLFHRERRDELKDALIEHVAALGGNQIDTITRTHIQKTVEMLVDGPQPEYFIDYAQDEHIYPLYCEGCISAPCCSGPITLLFEDIQKLTKVLGISRKKCLKDHVKRGHDEFGLPSYELKNTYPCEFLDKDARCTIYDNRPWACQMYPVRLGQGGPVLFVNDYCNFVFNLFKYECYARVFEEDFKIRFPHQHARMVELQMRYLS